jgi:hypothetical protein
MSDSTSILDLPTDPVGGGSINGNIAMKANEQPNANSSSSPAMALDQSTISQIVNGLQQASRTGATQLPSRDIPMTSGNISSDPNVMPNYVPPPEKNQVDYIQNYENANDMVNRYNKNKQMNNSLDDMYNEIQTPLLLAVLYFLFQLPFFKKFLYTYLSFLFSNDGNYNLNGFIFISIIFGMLFHILMKFTSYFGTF